MDWRTHEIFMSAMREFQAKNYSAAEELCLEVIQMQSALAPRARRYSAHALLGLIQNTQKRFPEAAENLKRALESNPSAIDLANNLAVVLNRIGRRDEAIAVLEESLKLAPASGVSCYHLGLFLLESRRAEEAVRALQRATELWPEGIESYVNLGQAYRELGLLGQAIETLESALRIQPEYARARCNLGVVLHESGRVEEALASLREGLYQFPLQPRAHSNLLFYLSYSPDIDQRSVYEEHRRWNEKFARPWAARIEPLSNDRDPNRRLRVGYVSSNFNEHSVAFFLEPILANHDREQVEIVCFSNTQDLDGYSERFKQLSISWYDIRTMSDEQVASCVRDAKIDILVDLTLHMIGNRLLVFARKPAPIQISYLGYPQTTGLTAMDYRLSDPLLDPPGWNEQYNSERLLRLPRSYFCYRPPDEAPVIPPLPARKSGRVSFGCFNTLAKFNLPTARLWAKVLAATLGSRLVMKARGLAEARTRDHVINTFASAGIDAERLHLLGGGSLREFLAQLGEIDIGLDPVPFSAGTTTCHTLWMGAPVVSLAGRSPVARMGLSVLTNAGLGELVAHTADRYVAIATDLASDLDRLDNLRQDMRQRLTESPLMDAKQFTRDLEGLYRRVWHEWLQSP